MRLLTALTLFFAFFTNAYADEFEWLPDNAVAVGTGCVKNQPGASDDVMFLSNGPDFSMVFTNLGFNYSANDGGPLSASKNCSFKVPFDIPTGYVPDQVIQELSFGVIKSAAARADLRFRSAIFGRPLKPYNVTYANGQSVMNPMRIGRSEDSFGNRLQAHPFERFCRQRARNKSQYVGDINLSGSRTNGAQDLVLVADSLDIRLEIKADMRTCESFPGGGNPNPNPNPQPQPQPQPSTLTLTDNIGASSINVPRHTHYSFYLIGQDSAGRPLSYGCYQNCVGVTTDPNTGLVDIDAQLNSTISYNMKFGVTNGAQTTYKTLVVNFL